MASSPLQLLVLHGGALGDCVLALHLVAAVRKALGEPRVTVAARSSIARWARRHDLVDEARSIEELGAHVFYHEDGPLEGEALRFLREYDAVVSFLGSRSEVVSQRLAAGLGREVLAIDPKPTPSASEAGVHIVRQWADQLRRQGIEMDDPEAMPMALPAGRRAALRKHLTERVGGGRERIVLCHPGSGGLTKCCPPATMERLVGTFRSRGWTPAWMMGPDEVERFGADHASPLDPSVPVLYEESVEAAADLAAGADAYIGCDAGMTHVAALAGVPTVALFGPTDPRIWRPLGTKCRIAPLPDSRGADEEWVRRIVSQLPDP